MTRRLLVLVAWAWALAWLWTVGVTAAGMWLAGLRM